VLNRTGNFNLAIKAQADKGTRAMYETKTKRKYHNLSVSCQLDLFDKVVKPIVLYGSEVWGFRNYHMVEKVHLKFCKLSLNLKTSTANSLVYGELGRFPLSVDIKQRMTSYWTKLISGKQIKLCSITYRLMFHLFSTQNVNFQWLTYVKGMFDECGLTYIWNSQNFLNERWIKEKIKQ
jgi:hypothetical protein